MRLRFDRRGILRDLDVGAHSDIHGGEVGVPHGRDGHGGRLAGGAGDALLHLEVLGGGGLGAGHAEVRGAQVGVDVVGVLGVAAGAGELEAGEEAADDGQTGADEADGRLNVRPQRGLVHGVGGVGGFDPEENDDAVDAGEADEGAEGEHAVQRELVLPGALQAPDHGDGEGQDDKVHDDVEGLIHDEERVSVEAVAIDALVPVGAQRAALQGTGEEDARPPEPDQRVQAERHPLEGFHGKQPAVETDDGDLDGGTQHEIGELVCQEDLQRSDWSG